MTVNFLEVFLASLLGGILGILFLIPFRKYFVRDMHGKYPFPEATAGTQVLVSGEKGGAQAKPLMIAGLIGGLFDFAVATFGLWHENFTSRALLWGDTVAEKAKLVLKCNTGAAVLGMGYIVGLKYAFIICCGSALVWWVIVPAIALLFPGLEVAQGIPAAGPSQDLRGQAATSPEEEATVLQDDVLPAEDAAVSADNNDRKAVAEAGLLDEGDPLEGYSGSHDGEDWSDYLSASMDESGNGGGRLQLKLSLGGGTASSETSSTFDTRQFYHGAPSSAKVPEYSGSSRTMFAAQAPSVTNTTVHKRPVRAEVLVHIPVFWRFGVETGLAYSVLRSSFDTTSGTTRTEESQTLRYLGLPLNLTADVFRNRWMTAYLSGGAIAAKCISADVRTTTVNVLSGDNLTDPEKTDLTVEPWLFSLNATAGFQFNVTPAIGLYAAPGVSYHFDDKSGLQTFYKEHPLDFVLSFGLRFNFK
jgi:hypothetical protein